eukprot:CAMPEP_0201681306 /NCGR_PEP_ID=MMETSP0494-20130426/51046_1 /ASSEMBLY_ACC=CAM_ASM_000839 /TAXON_ID=420259 /ORGANISM="Thalassiosira gravida, Strain GMp14c1" /LENGTH=857 /DNA_ID=CAMNT_0048165047 /DNA_START=288 /DNA_END=2861 /DNA_ORIENTATION=+
MFLSASSTCTSSALLATPGCFVSTQFRHRSNAKGDIAHHRATNLGLSLSKPQHYLLHLPVQLSSSLRRSSRLTMNQNDDEESIGSEDQGEEEECNDVKSNLNSISWLPSVKLGKQPYRPSSSGRRAPLSRKENSDGDGYESAEGSSSNSGSNSPPGFQNIEILPVLPMTMVHGLEGILMDSSAQDEESIDGMDHDNHNPYYNGPESYFGAGVWEEDSSSSIVGNSLGPIFSGTSSYLPHTKGHVFTVAEPRYKKLYDDLIRIGNYYGMKRESAMRRSRAAATKQDEVVQDLGDNEGGDESQNASSAAAVPSTPATTSSLPDPDEKRRFIVTTTHPSKDGVFAEYGLLFQLKDLDEVAAVASYEMGGGEEEGMMTLGELQDLVESVDVQQGYDPGEMSEDGEDIMDILLRTHYEATHDVVGRVKIHRFVNPECYNESGPEGEDYLMAEATVLEVVENDHAKMLKERKKRQKTAAAASQEVKEDVQPATSTSLTAESATKAGLEEQGVIGSDNVAKAVARIKEELRSTMGEAFKQQQQPSQQSQQVDPERMKDKLRATLDEAPHLSPSNSNGTSNASSSSTLRGKKGSGPIPLVPKGILVERRPTESLSPPERELRESFAKLVSLQHELKEECRFTRVSIQTFGIGPVGVWLSAAAWSQFVEKRLEASHGDMQSDLQERLTEYLGLDSSGASQPREGGGNYFSEKYGSEENEDVMEGETIDFEDLSPELQQEFQLIQARATTELGPLALERAIQMQRIVQAGSYTERLDLLRECVDNERRRLEAKRMLRSLGLGQPSSGDGNVDGNGRSGEGGKYVSSGGGGVISRDEARSIFERLMSATENVDNKYDLSNDEEDEAFQ